MCSRSCGVVERPLSALCTVQWLDPSRARYFKNLYSWFMAQRSGWYLSASWVQCVWSLESFHSGPFGIMLVYAGRFARSWQLFDTQQTTHVRLKCISQIKGEKTSQSLLKPTIHHSAYSLARNRHLAPVWPDISDRWPPPPWTCWCFFGRCCPTQVGEHRWEASNGTLKAGQSKTASINGILNGHIYGARYQPIQPYQPPSAH